MYKSIVSLVILNIIVQVLQSDDGLEFADYKRAAESFLRECSYRQRVNAGNAQIATEFSVRLERRAFYLKLVKQKIRG